MAQAIVSGRLTGDLPSEKALGEHYGLSRVTTRRALNVLAENGMVTATWGKGWSVTYGHLSEPANTLVSATELAAARNLIVSSRVLAARVEPASLDVAELLNIAPGAPIFFLDRVRYNNGVTFARQISRIPADRVAGIEKIDFSTQSLYQVLETSFGVAPTWADYAVEARPADTEQAGLLGVAEGSSLLLATQTTYDQHGVAFEQSWSAYPYDRYRVRATLTRLNRAANKSFDARN